MNWNTAVLLTNITHQEELVQDLASQVESKRIELGLSPDEATSKELTKLKASLEAQKSQIFNECKSFADYFKKDTTPIRKKYKVEALLELLDYKERAEALLVELKAKLESRQNK